MSSINLRVNCQFSFNNVSQLISCDNDILSNNLVPLNIVLSILTLLVSAVFFTLVLIYYFVYRNYYSQVETNYDGSNAASKNSELQMVTVASPTSTFSPSPAPPQPPPSAESVFSTAPTENSAPYIPPFLITAPTSSPAAASGELSPTSPTSPALAVAPLTDQKQVVPTTPTASKKPDVKAILKFIVVDVILPAISLLLELFFILITFAKALIPIRQFAFVSDDITTVVLRWIFEDERFILYKGLGYLAIVIVCLLVWSISVPYVLTFSFRLSYDKRNVFPIHEGQDSPSTVKLKKVANAILNVLKKLPNLVFVKIFSFVLSYYSKTIIMLFGVAPILALSYYALPIFLLMVCGFTVQGFWVAFERTRQATGNFILSVEEIKKHKAEDVKEHYLGVAKQSIILIILFCIGIIGHILKLLVAFPEPQVLSFKCWWCSLLPESMRNKKKKMKPEDKVNISMHDWMFFCANYSKGFLIPIPIFGPFLFLSATALAASGFWLTPYWLFYKKSGLEADSNAVKKEEQEEDIQKKSEEEMEKKEAIPAATELAPTQGQTNSTEQPAESANTSNSVQPSEPAAAPTEAEPEAPPKVIKQPVYEKDVFKRIFFFLYEPFNANDLREKGYLHEAKKSGKDNMLDIFVLRRLETWKNVDESEIKFIDAIKDQGKVVRMIKMLAIPFIVIVAFIAPQGFDLIDIILRGLRIK